MASSALQGAVKAALFKSPAARGAAVAAVQGAVAQRVSQLTTPASERIAWDVYQWPHPRLGILHLDLAELATKRPALYPLVRQLYVWWVAVMCALGLNFADSLVLVSTIKGGAYSALSPFFSFLTFLSLGSSAFTVMRFWYHGACESNGRSKTIARAVLCVLDFMWLLFALMPSNNVLGIAGFAQSSRHERAAAEGTASGALAYWQAATVLESLAFFGLLCWSAFLTFRLFTDKA